GDRQQRHRHHGRPGQLPEPRYGCPRYSGQLRQPAAETVRRDTLQSTIPPRLHHQWRADGTLSDWHTAAAATGRNSAAGGESVHQSGTPGRRTLCAYQDTGRRRGLQGGGTFLTTGLTTGLKAGLKTGRRGVATPRPAPAARVPGALPRCRGGRAEFSPPATAPRSNP